MDCVLIGTTTGSLGASISHLKQSDLDFLTSGVGTRAHSPPSLFGSTTGSLQANVTGSLGASVTGSLAASTRITLNATWCYKRAGAT